MNPAALAVAHDPCALIATSADCTVSTLFLDSTRTVSRWRTAEQGRCRRRKNNDASDVRVRSRKLDACPPRETEGSRAGQTAAWWLCCQVP